MTKDDELVSWQTIDESAVAAAQNSKQPMTRNSSAFKLILAPIWPHRVHRCLLPTLTLGAVDSALAAAAAAASLASFSCCCLVLVAVLPLPPAKSMSNSVPLNSFCFALFALS